MRIKNTVRNGIWAAASYILIFLLGLVARKAFLSNFDSVLLGYNGTIANIFSLISVAEAGVGTVISYGLYRELKHKNEHEIAVLMTIYKWMYRIIGMLVVVAGTVCFFLLPLIIVEENTNWNDVYMVYGLEFANAVLVYFLSFRRLLFIADQKAYKCVRVDTVTQIGAYLVRIAVAYLTDWYMLYLAATFIATALANIIIIVMYNRDYPYAKTKITFKDVKDRGVLKDMWSYFIQKLSIAIYGGIDNIIAMRVFGPATVVLIGNYTTIEQGVSGFFNKLLSGFQAGIGDLIYDDERENKISVFNGLNYLSFMLASFAAVSYLALFQPFITFWIGDKYILPFSFVIWFAVNQYIGWNHRIIVNFRSAIGKFEQDRVYMIFSALSNVVLSLIFIKFFGVAGLLTATCIAHMFQWVGRSQVIFDNIFKGYKAKYWRKQVFLFVLAVAECAATVLVCSLLPDGIIGIGIRGVFCLVFPNLVNTLVFWKNKDFDFVKETVCTMLIKLKERIKHR